MRLLIVSNRLPITIVKKEGKLKFQESVGGLVSGLSSYLDSLKGSTFTKAEYIWVGWPGLAIDDKTKEKLKTTAMGRFHAYPIFLSANTMDKFYQGFCNKTIWPLFHYFPSYAIYDEDYWNYYKSVNETFCEAISKIIKPKDVVWIHDYHLMLLPKLLREKKPDTPIGFFLHIPFPSFEIYRLLPKVWRREILEGILGADLIGFHNYDYTRHFLSCVLRILGFEHDLGRLAIGDRKVKADTFPMGIDFKKFYGAVNNLEVQKEKKKLKKTLSDYKVILSVDRLDYSKGILNRLEGFELFLEKNPQWHQKVILLLVLVPSRIGVEHYQQIKKQIDEVIGRINGRFGRIDWTPILYQYKFFPFQPLVAIYSVSDIALVTPLRDGMNLIAKEYLASRVDKTGVLILSEMAGAANELGEAVVINPNNREEIAEALKTALEISPEEQIRRNQIMQDRLIRYDVVRWADDYMRNLLSLSDYQKQFKARLLDSQSQERLYNDFKKAKSRIIFLDYDGTLVPFVGQPEMAIPNEELLNSLRNLANDPKTKLVIVSGRDRNTLLNWFGSLNIEFIAEHGVWIKEKNKEWQQIKPLANYWKAQIMPILKIYVDRLPGSFIEEKEFSVVWHYRKADPELASLRAKELVDELVNFTANIDLQVLLGSKVVEIRNAGINKGSGGMYFLDKKNYNFILAIGDDWTDEDLFKVLPEKSYSIRVGITPSNAKFNLSSYLDVLKLITKLNK